MRIKTLEIMNIASIEQAYIDFDAKPLSDTDLFLITGDTGSGKSTILDAICVALYNKSPRLKGDGKKVDVNGIDEMKSGDPRNLMRAGTGESQIILCFDGNDGKEYKATWYVKRGKAKKANQRADNQFWSIKNLTDKEETSADKQPKDKDLSKESGYSDVLNVIEKAVGLNFDQFCRTTMLPQGQFAEFLKSTDKSIILEKISGTEIYSKIGKSISSLAKKAKDAYEDEEKDHAKIKVMDPLERQKTEDDLAAKQNQARKTSDEINDLDIRIKWIEDNIEKANMLSKARAELVKFSSQTNDPAFKAEVCDLDDWTKTIFVRQQIRKRDEGREALNKIQQELLRHEQEWKLCLNGEAWIIGQTKDLSDKLVRLDNEIEGQKNNKSAFEEAKVIKAKLESLKQLKSKLISLKKSLEQKNDKLKEEKTELDKYELAHKQAKDELNRSKDELNLKKAVIDDSNLPVLREQKEFYLKLHTHKETLTDCLNELNRCKARISELESLTPGLEENKKRQTLALEELTRRHELQRETVEDTVKAIRAKLSGVLDTEDGVCPVCRQRVTKLPADDVIAETYAKFKTEYDAQKEQEKLASDALTRHTAELEMQEKKHDDQQMKYLQKSEQMKQDLKKRDDEESLLNMSIEQVVEKIDSLKEGITKGEKLEKEHKKILEEVERKAVIVTDAEKTLTEKNTEIKLLNQSINDTKQQIKTSEETINGLEDEVRRQLEGSSDWESDWTNAAMIDEFCEELVRKADNYASLVRDKGETENLLGQQKEVIKDISQTKVEITSVMNGWKEDNVCATEERDIRNRWHKLMVEVKTLATQQKAARTGIDTSDKNIQDFCQENPSLDIVRLVSLDRITDVEYKRRKDIVDEALKGYNTAKGNVNGCTDAYNQHIAKRPQGNCNPADLQKLKGDKKQKDNDYTILNQAIGTLERIIMSDDENLKKKGNTMLLDQLRAVKDKWAALSAELGDSDGEKMRRIAQCFILDSLLKAANEHLKNLAPRFRLLRAKPKKSDESGNSHLDLMLEDAENGYSTRLTNAISGGESFLVSLALALALADFGQHLGVSTLFIDEGFGTLSGNPLQSAISTLKSLHSQSGKRVGIISHREEVRSSIPVQIEVKQSAGTSASKIEIKCVN